MTAHGYHVDVVTDARIPTTDGGLTLSADLFLPRGAGPAPAIVSLLPYRKDLLGGAGVWDTLAWFAARGYACVLVDVRGTGSSDGPMRPPFDPSEADDGVAAVTWAARQPWCTGAVGMWGFSYGAVIALRTATRRVADLKAIVSVMGMLDPELDFVHPGGAHGCLMPLGVWGLGTLRDLILPAMRVHHSPAEWRRWRDRVDHAEPYLLDLYRHRPAHDVWRTRVVDAVAVATPVLCFGGWQDMFCNGSVRIFELVRGPRKLVVGPWSHSVPHEAPVQPVDVHAMALRWWDRWLRDVSDGADTEPPVTVFVQGGEPRWLDFDEWPPDGIDNPLFAGPDGSLSGEPSSVDLLVSAHRDPTVGTLSGLWGISSGSGQLLDQHDDDMRCVTFTGPPADEPLLLIGRPTVDLDRPAGRLVVKLTDVDQDGRSNFVTGGVCASGGQPVVLDPTCYELQPGHRLRVVVSDAAFPRLWPAVNEAASDLCVSRLKLSLPTVPTGHGKPATVPQLDEPHHSAVWVSFSPRWKIRRDPIRGSVGVVVGDSIVARIPASPMLVETDTRLSATIQDGASAVARVEGTASATVHMPTGEAVVARVEVSLTSDSAVATGHLIIDGYAVVDRQWRS